MSELTYRLETERPNRKLCIAAATRIAELEDTLLALESHAYGIKPLNTTLLEHVQNALYEREVAVALKKRE